MASKTSQLGHYAVKQALFAATPLGVAAQAIVPIANGLRKLFGRERRPTAFRTQHGGIFGNLWSKTYARVAKDGQRLVDDRLLALSKSPDNLERQRALVLGLLEFASLYGTESMRPEFREIVDTIGGPATPLVSPPAWASGAPIEAAAKPWISSSEQAAPLSINRPEPIFSTLELGPVQSIVDSGFRLPAVALDPPASAQLERSTLTPTAEATAIAQPAGAPAALLVLAAIAAWLVIR